MGFVKSVKCPKTFRETEDLEVWRNRKDSIKFLRNISVKTDEFRNKCVMFAFFLCLQE